ncbi:Vps62-related protein [Streptomyces sp. NPDC002054]|uniref:Vps62-related protein n=1 Tax=Streptomyces sp. NPDC002054 TaxID=3154663 RepID=UPI003327F8FD
MATKTMAFGELELAFTDKFSWCWDDEDTGGEHWVSFWHPEAPKGFLPLGTMAIPAWGSANLNPTTGAKKVTDHVVALCVKESGTTAKDMAPPLAAPIAYEKIWRDVGTGGKYKGSLWRPIPPEGYVAMGCVVPKDSYEEPSLDAVTCVRADLTDQSTATLVYNDKGTGGKEAVSAWRNDVPPAYVDNTSGDTRALISANTFTSHAAYGKPKSLPDMRVLCLPMPTVKEPWPPAPELSGRSRPAERTDPVTANALWIPFTAVSDSERSVPWKLQHSPFYRIERKVSWELVDHIDNNTESPAKLSRAITTGVEKESAHAFQLSTGISVNATAGVSGVVASASVSTTYSLELGFSQSTSVKELESKTVTVEKDVLPDTSLAVWVGSNSLQVVRADHTLVGSPLQFRGKNSVRYDQYPDKASASK